MRYLIVLIVVGLSTSSAQASICNLLLSILRVHPETASELTKRIAREKSAHIQLAIIKAEAEWIVAVSPVEVLEILEAIKPSSALFDSLSLGDYRMQAYELLDSKMVPALSQLPFEEAYLFREKLRAQASSTSYRSRDLNIRKELNNDDYLVPLNDFKRLLKSNPAFLVKLLQDRNGWRLIFDPRALLKALEEVKITLTSDFTRILLNHIIGKLDKLSFLKGFLESKVPMEEDVRSVVEQTIAKLQERAGIGFNDFYKRVQSGGDNTFLFHHAVKNPAAFDDMVLDYIRKESTDLSLNQVWSLTDWMQEEEGPTKLVAISIWFHDNLPRVSVEDMDRLKKSMRDGNRWQRIWLKRNAN